MRSSCMARSWWACVVIYSVAGSGAARAEHRKFIEPSGMRDAARPRLRQVRTEHVCDLVGLGGFSSVPFNFPGVANTATLVQIPPSFLALPEAVLPPGGQPRVPRVLAGDMDVPYQGRDGRVHFIFNDTVSPPSAGVIPCADGVTGCSPVVVNDDVLASTVAGPWGSGQACLQLEIAAGQTAEEYEPITWLGDVSEGGRRLGPGIVPGPAFDSGRYTFMLVPDGLLGMCSVAAQDCTQVSGMESDVCIGQSSTSAQGTCHFGPCGSDERSACALRLSPSTLAVQAEKSNFVTPQLGLHVQTDAVLRAFRGHFSTVSFFSEVRDGDGVVWVIGRDSYWGTEGLAMHPYLMRIPVQRGVLGTPEYFGGSAASGPIFSPDPGTAKPIFQETRWLNQHSSFMRVQNYMGGMWLMIYGGHSQPVLRQTLATFVRPVVDSLFYDRDSGIYARWATSPWGPWSEPVTIFNPYVRGSGGYCERMYFEDREDKSDFTCPIENEETNRGLNRVPSAGMAGEYGAGLLPGYMSTSADGRTLSFEWLMSTWNPYRVIVLRSELTMD